MLINTVDENKSKYSNADYSHAQLAHRIQQMIGCPSVCDFLHFMDYNLLLTALSPGRDKLTAEHIFGPDLGSLKGKTVQQKPILVKVHTTSIPATIMEQYLRVTLAAHVMYVNKIPFFISMAQDIKFSMVQKLDNQKTPMLLDAIKKIQQVYHIVASRYSISLWMDSLNPFMVIWLLLLQSHHRLCTQP